MSFFKSRGRMKTTTQRDPEVLDEGLLLKSVGGDREYLSEVVGLIQAAWPTLLADLREGMARGNLCAVEKTARLSKAAAHNVAAIRAYKSALQLETMAAKGDWQALQRTLASLCREVELLQSFLTTLADPGCPP